MANPKVKRLRRLMAQVVNHQIRSMAKMEEIAKTFGEFHADYQEMLELIATNCALTMKWCKDVSEKAWGYWPNDLNSWLK